MVEVVEEQQLELELSVSSARCRSCCSQASSPSSNASSPKWALMTLSGVDIMSMVRGCRKLRWLSDFSGEGMVRDTARSSARREYDLWVAPLLLDGSSSRQLSSNIAGFSGMWSTLGCGEHNLLGEMLDHVVMSLDGDVTNLVGVTNFPGEANLDGERNLLGEVMLSRLSPGRHSFLGVLRDQDVASPAATLASSRSDPCMRHLNISPIWVSRTRLKVKLDACCSVRISKSDRSWIELL